MPQPAWLDQLTHTGDEENLFLRIFLYGKPGTGKTRFIGSAPNPFILAAENGTLTLHKNKGIPVMPLDETKDPNVYKTVMDILIQATNRSGPFEEGGKLAHVKTIAIDSYSALNEMLMRQMLTKGRRDKPEFDDWGRLKNQMSTIAHHHTTGPFNSIGITGEGAREDKYDKEIVPVPNMAGSFRDDIMHLFDFNIWMHKKVVGTNRKYYGALNDTKGRCAKSRIEELPPVIEDITFDIIKKALG